MNPDAVRGLAQPDQRSCGASSLVAARMLLDPGYARVVASGGTFAHEALDMHRRVTGLVDASGRVQLPWPRALGTPPWAVARQMSAYTGPDLPATDYDVHVVLRDRAGLVARMQEATAADRPVPFYVGDRWIPRHVVLAVAPTAAGLRVYNPARGTLADADAAAFVGSTLPFGRWVKPWFVVLPALF